MAPTSVVFSLLTLLGFTAAQNPIFSGFPDNFNQLFGDDNNDLFNAPSGSPNTIGGFSFPSTFGGFNLGDFGTPSTPTPTPASSPGGLFGDFGFTGGNILNQFATPSNSLSQFAQGLQNVEAPNIVEVSGSVSFADIDCEQVDLTSLVQKLKEEIAKEAGCSDSSCVEMGTPQCGSLTVTYKITLNIEALGISVSLQNTVTGSIGEVVQEIVEDVVVFVAAQNVLALFGISSTIVVEIQDVQFQSPTPSPPTLPSPSPYGGKKGMMVDIQETEEVVNTFTYLDAILD